MRDFLKSLKTSVSGSIKMQMEISEALSEAEIFGCILKQCEITFFRSAMRGKKEQDTLFYFDLAHR